MAVNAFNQFWYRPNPWQHNSDGSSTHYLGGGLMEVVRGTPNFVVDHHRQACGFNFADGGQVISAQPSNLLTFVSIPSKYPLCACCNLSTYGHDEGMCKKNNTCKHCGIQTVEHKKNEDKCPTKLALIRKTETETTLTTNFGLSKYRFEPCNNGIMVFDLKGNFINHFTPKELEDFILKEKPKKGSISEIMNGVSEEATPSVPTVVIAPPTPSIKEELKPSILRKTSPPTVNPPVNVYKETRNNLRKTQITFKDIDDSEPTNSTIPNNQNSSSPNRSCDEYGESDYEV